MTVDRTELIRRVEAFIYREVDLADENKYAEWEQLWGSEGTYWVPLTPDDDPTTDTSIIFDNRRRITVRVNQLIEGRRPTQTPTSRLRRVVSNVQLIEPEQVNLPSSLGPPSWDVSASANFVGVEAHEERRTLFAGRVEYGLRTGDESFELVFKRIDLVDSDQPLRTLSFIL